MLYFKNMTTIIKKIIFFLSFALCLASCSQYQKALNSEDVTFKYRVADSLYSQEKYSKAIRLFEQIAPGYRGKPQAEKMYYMYAMSTYKQKQYMMSSHLFERFVAQYSYSQKAEEAWFLMGKSYAELSPRYSLDQIDTYKAIDKLQQFINKYPESEYVAEANAIVAELNRKIEKKHFENAKQYNTIAGYTRDYKAAIVALDNFLVEFPGTIYAEDALYYKFDSMYNIAINSVPDKKRERLNQAKSAYEALIKLNADTKYKDKANKMLTEIENELQKI